MAVSFPAGYVPVQKSGGPTPIPQLELEAQALVSKIIQGLSHFQVTDYQSAIQDPNGRYRVASALQKCIRRGEAEKAVLYAQAMFNSEHQEYLMRRLPVIAMEDVGPGNWDVVMQTMHFCRYKSVRNVVGAFEGLSYLVHQLASGLKSRALCEVVCSVHFLRGEPEDYVMAALKAMFGLGWIPEDKKHPVFATGIKGTPADETMAAVHALRPDLQYLFHVCSKKPVDYLQAAMPMVLKAETEAPLCVNETAFPEYKMLKGVPEWSFDQHTLEGKKAISYVLKLHVVPPTTTWAQLAMILFQVESAALDRQHVNARLKYMQLACDEAEARYVGMSPQQHQDLIEILATDAFRERMSYARQKVTAK